MHAGAVEAVCMAKSTARQGPTCCPATGPHPGAWACGRPPPWACWLPGRQSPAAAPPLPAPRPPGPGASCGRGGPASIFSGGSGTAPLCCHPNRSFDAAPWTTEQQSGTRPAICPRKALASTALLAPTHVSAEHVPSARMLACFSCMPQPTCPQSPSSFAPPAPAARGWPWLR